MVTLYATTVNVRCKWDFTAKADCKVEIETKNVFCVLLPAFGFHVHPKLVKIHFLALYRGFNCFSYCLSKKRKRCKDVKRFILWLGKAGWHPNTGRIQMRVPNFACFWFKICKNMYAFDYQVMKYHRKSGK